MNDALYIAATGMQAQQFGVDTIANNLANVNTPGFKAGRVSFQDLVYQELAQVEGLNTGRPSLAQGLGVSVGGLSKIFLQGELRQTDNPLDIAIPGQGFLEVAMPDGTTAFSRGGSLRVNSEGFLSTAEGNLLKPNIFVGTDLKSIKIEANGKVMVTSVNQTVPNEVGRIDIAVFSDSTGLRALGRNLYASSERSGEAEIGRPGEDGFSALAPGFIESSNVKLADEIVNLLVAQRAYSASVKVIQAADEMLSMSNNLRR